MRTIAIVNQKGGCGKTTTAISLAGHFASRGQSTLLVDLDPQSHCAAGLAVPEQRIDLDVGDALLANEDRPLPTDRLLWRVQRNLDLMPSRVGLAGLEAGRGRLSKIPHPERRLAEVLTRLADRYRICVLDCSPSIGLLTYNALAAATDILIPVDTGFFSLQGASRQVSTIRSMGRRMSRMTPFWLVATLHDADSPLSQDLLGELRRRFEERIAPVVIHRNAALKEAASFGVPICQYAPESDAAEEYAALAEWLIDRQLPSARSAEEEIEQGTANLEEAKQGERSAAARESPVHVRVTHRPPPGLARRLADPRESEEPENTRRAAEEQRVPTTLVEAKTSNGAERDPCLHNRLEQLRVAGATAWSERRSGTTTTLVAPPPAPAPASPPAPAPDTRHQAPARIPEPTLEIGPLPATHSGPAPSLDESQTAPASEPESPEEPPVHEPVAPVPEPPPAPPPEPAPRPGPSVQAGRVRLVVPTYMGSAVEVAGDFNGWQANVSPMRRVEKHDVFEITFTLGPGRYEYRLVIDGQWTADPFNDHQCLNPFGEPNSVIEVPPA